jgi:hypothetical protein
MLNKQLFDVRMKKLTKAWEEEKARAELLYKYCHGDIDDWGLDLAIDLMDDIFSPSDNWISWWFLENECGKHKMEAGYGGVITKVKTVKDLWKLICIEEARNE